MYWYIGATTFFGEKLRKVLKQVLLTARDALKVHPMILLVTLLYTKQLSLTT